MAHGKRSTRRVSELAGDAPQLASSADFTEHGYVTPPTLKGNRAAKKPGRINLRAVAEVLAEDGLDPAAEMVRILKAQVPLRDRQGMIVMDSEGKAIMQDVVDSDVKLRMLNELLQYTQPKLKAVEVTGKNGGPIAVANLSTEQAEKIAREFLLATQGDDADD